MLARILIGDVLERLRELPEASVQCVVTSPPYWGLRDYGTGQWAGGDAGCEHSVGGQVQDSKAPGAIVTGQRPGVDSSMCRKCGATRIDQQLGLEKTPEEYIAKMVAVFREVRRVLRYDGTLFLNIGDSYAGSPAGNFAPGMSKPGDVVLDPFSGSGTTGVVALRYHRDFVGIELNPTYAALAEKRIGEESPMFNRVELTTTSEVE